MSDHNPFRAEIEQILTTHPRTRFAKVMLGMKRGLTDVEMSQEATAAGEPIRADGIAAVRRIVRLTLNGEFVTAPSEAEEQSNLFRELLNYPRSPELQQHINACLAHLGTVGPNVRTTPLGQSHLGANDPPRAARWQPKCVKCNIEHAGECA
jgi:hypothetical protein